MRLFVLVLLAAFLGNLSSLYVMEEIRNHRARLAAEELERKTAEQRRMRQEKGGQVREMLRRGLQERGLPVQEDPGFEGGAGSAE